MTKDTFMIFFHYFLSGAFFETIQWIHFCSTSENLNRQSNINFLSFHFIFISSDEWIASFIFCLCFSQSVPGITQKNVLMIWMSLFCFFFLFDYKFDSNTDTNFVCVSGNFNIDEILSFLFYFIFLRHLLDINGINGMLNIFFL